MKFGTFITSQRPEKIASNVRAAEACGFESAWIGEHLIIPVDYTSKYPYSPDGRFPAPPEIPFHDPMLALAFAAAVTSRIRLATGIFVVPLARAVSRREVDRGIAICGSGVGACIVANKIRKVRAGIIHDIFSSRQGVEDDDMNMICLGAHLETASRAEALVQCFLDSRFSEQPRHRRRLEKISNLEKEWGRSDDPKPSR